MNTIVQNIFVFITVLLAVGFLFRKYLWKKTAEKSCGTDDCGCH